MITEDKQTKVISAIMSRYGSLTDLYSAMSECEDTVLCNLESDINGVCDMDEISEIIGITQV